MTAGSRCSGLLNLALFLLFPTSIRSFAYNPAPQYAAPKPAYLEEEWWTPVEQTTLPTLDQSNAEPDANEALMNTLFKGKACWEIDDPEIVEVEECELIDSSIDELLQMPNDLPSIPCLTTLDGCTDAMRSGISERDARGTVSTEPADELISKQLLDPCFWNEECFLE